jgi:hypothetical protein
MPNGRRCYAERGEQPDGQLRRPAHAEPHGDAQSLIVVGASHF